jgi:hypothetical protein
MIAACFVMSSSMRSAAQRREPLGSSNSVAEPFFPQLPVGSV